MVTTNVAEPGSAERAACYRLAFDIFHREMGALADVVDHENGLLADELIEGAHVLCASVDGEVVGSIGILLGSDGRFPDFFESSFGIDRFETVVDRAEMAINIRFLVTEPHRAGSVPLALIVAAAEFQQDRGIRLSFADCQPHLLNLYQTLGFRPCAPVFDQPGFGLMVPLVMIVDDDDYLRSVDSPLLSHFGSGAEGPTATDQAAIERTVEQALALLPTTPPVVEPGVQGEVSWAEAYEILSRSDSGIGAFQGLSEADVEALLEASRIITCDRGRQIVLEDQGTRTVYVVLDGTVEVKVGRTVLARLGRGQPFGEIAFLLRSKRTADAVAASEEVRVLALSERVLHRLIDSNSELAARFLLNLSRTLALKVMRQAVRPGP